MPSQQEFGANNPGPPPRRSAEAPSCPQCQGRMAVKQVLPVLFAPDVEDVVYGCDGCGTEAKRTVRRT